MYAGPGAGPLTAAAAAWAELATELYGTAARFAAILADLADGWLGPSSLMMATAAAPFVAWLHDSGGVAERTAAQAQAATAAYEVAFAMTVPPAVIAANRSLLLTLIATNLFGQNTPAIAATELQYTTMWIQDAVAMQGYAESSAAAGQLSPFPPPRSKTDPSLTDYLEHVPNVVNTVMSNTSAAVSGRGIYVANARLAAQAGGEIHGAPVGGTQLPSAVRRHWNPVSATTGRAIATGSLSVPAGWVTAAQVRDNPPAATGRLTSITAAAQTPLASAPEFSAAGLGTLARPGSTEPRPESRPVIVRSPAAR